MTKKRSRAMLLYSVSGNGLAQGYREVEDKTHNKKEWQWVPHPAKECSEYQRYYTLIYHF